MITRIEPGASKSRAVVHGGTVYVAGTTADDLSADLAGQVRQVLAKIDRYLALAGTDKSRLLHANVWLRDIAGFEIMNEVWNAWVDPQNPPARATVEAHLPGDRYLVEIMAIGAL